MKLRDGEPCEHAGCLSHISHPCDGCGRIGGRSPAPSVADLQKSYGEAKFGAEADIPGQFYYEPLEDHTWPTYGGITRSSLASGWNHTLPLNDRKISK